MTDARSPEHDSHPLKGRWRPASPYVWGGHVSPQFVLVVVLAHAVVAGWFVSDWDQARMVLYDFHEVHSEALVNVPPEALARDYGYAEDPVDALRRYKAIAAPLVAGATTAGERARRLGDYIYSLRSPTPVDFDEDLRYGPDVLLERMQAGAHANGGQMSAVLAPFWRSLGGHTRGVRFGTHRGALGHYAVELWDADGARWFYYDMNLNSFAHDDDGVTPLSVAALQPICSPAKISTLRRIRRTTTSRSTSWRGQGDRHGHPQVHPQADRQGGTGHGHPQRFERKNPALPDPPERALRGRGAASLHLSRSIPPPAGFNKILSVDLAVVLT